MSIFLICYSTKPYSNKLNEAIKSKIKEYGTNCKNLDDTQWYVYDKNNDCSKIRDSIVLTFNLTKIVESDTNTVLKLSVNKVDNASFENESQVENWFTLKNLSHLLE